MVSTCPLISKSSSPCTDYYYHYIPGDFFTLALVDGLSLDFGGGGSKSPHISSTLLSILADLNNAVVWIVLIRPPLFKSSSPLSKRLESVPSAQMTIGITVILMFLSFLRSLARRENPLYNKFFLPLSFFQIITRSGILVGIRWYVLYLKIPLNVIRLIFQERF